jgi:hypothetical protein
MVGGEGGVRGGALVGFTAGMGVGTVGAGGCWHLLCDC